MKRSTYQHDICPTQDEAEWHIVVLVLHAYGFSLWDNEGESALSELLFWKLSDRVQACGDNKGEMPGLSSLLL